MKFKIAIIILAFISNNILYSNTQNTNAANDIITADEVIKEIKKLSTDNLIEKSFNKRISAQDKKQVLDSMQTEIQYYEKYKLSLIGQAGQFGRLFFGFCGTAVFLGLGYEQLQRRKNYYGDVWHKHKYNYSYQSTGNLAVLLSLLSVLSFSQFILAIKSLRMNDHLITMRNMELFVKVMPVKR